MKQCTVCKETKELDQFYNVKSTKDGKGYRCKECDNKARQKWSEKNPERAHLSQRQRNLKHRFGVDLKWYEEQFKKQNYSCAICEAKTNKTVGERQFWNFSVDHCHDSGRVRGILCNNCNRALGLFQDDYGLLMKAAKYVSEN